MEGTILYLIIILLKSEAVTGFEKRQSDVTHAHTQVTTS
jgi:hypothetical protein